MQCCYCIRRVYFPYSIHDTETHKNGPGAYDDDGTQWTGAIKKKHQTNWDHHPHTSTRTKSVCMMSFCLHNVHAIICIYIYIYIRFVTRVSSVRVADRARIRGYDTIKYYNMLHNCLISLHFYWYRAQGLLAQIAQHQTTNAIYALLLDCVKFM